MPRGTRREGRRKGLNGQAQGLNGQAQGLNGQAQGLNGQAQRSATTIFLSLVSYLSTHDSLCLCYFYSADFQFRTF